MMQSAFVHRVRRDWRRYTFGGVGLFLAASGGACSNPGYRTLVYPGQQGQYSVQHVPETAPAPAPNQGVQSAVPAPSAVQGSAAGAEPMAPTTAPMDENLSEVEANWSKLSDSDKALLAATAKRLAGGK
jgi:hypothetical protein